MQTTEQYLPISVHITYNIAKIILKTANTILLLLFCILLNTAILNLLCTKQQDIKKLNCSFKNENHLTKAIFLPYFFFKVVYFQYLLSFIHY